MTFAASVSGKTTAFSSAIQIMRVVPIRCRSDKRNRTTFILAHAIEVRSNLSGLRTGTTSKTQSGGRSQKNKHKKNRFYALVEAAVLLYAENRERDSDDTDERHGVNRYAWHFTVIIERLPEHVEHDRVDEERH